MNQLTKLFLPVVVLGLCVLGQNNKLFAQIQEGDYYMVGYGFGTVSSGAAYGYKNSANKTFNLDYYEDSFSHSSFHIKYMSIDDDFYMGMDFEILATLVAAMTGALGDGFDITSYPGTGEWNDLDKNLSQFKNRTDPKLYSTGTDFTYGNLDLLFGDSEMKFGAHVGLNGVGGNDDDEYNNFEAFSGAEHNFHYLANKIFWTIGGAHQYTIMENLFVTTRASLIWGWKDNGVRELDSSTWGFEIYPNIRFLYGEDIGLFADVYMKYRSFSELESKVKTQNINEKITIPGFSTMHFGLAVGVYLNN